MASALTKVRADVGARFEDLKERFDRLSDSERRLVGLLGAAVIALLVLGTAAWISSELSDLEEYNAAVRKALKDLRKYEAPYLERRRSAETLERRIGSSQLELNSYIEGIASAVGVTIAESGEQSPVELGAFTQRGLELKLSKLSMTQLANLLKRIEDEPGHLVQVTRLSVRTRWKKNEELDVEMVVSTYERSADKAPASRRLSRR